MTDRRLEFTGDFSFKPSPSITIDYKAGQVAFVTAACAAKAIERGKARPYRDPGAPPAGIAATIAKKAPKRAAKKAAKRG